MEDTVSQPASTRPPDLPLFYIAPSDDDPENLDASYRALTSKNDMIKALETDILKIIASECERQINITKGKMPKIVFLYPRFLASTKLFPILAPFLKKTIRSAGKRARGAMSASVRWTRRYHVTHLNALNEVFPTLFLSRVYPNEAGSFNFDPSRGELAGGLLTPLVDEDNIAEVTYYWHTQSCQIECFLSKKKCEVSDDGQVTFRELLM